MLANKTDVASAKDNFAKLSSVFSHTHIIPISALHGQGFKEVKACVARNI
jgi:predicted GTPase